ncbi:MAG TPA: hypothetical protein VH062_26660 [Polyangiaceae bacterium]|nr:hypothetical protein [Polyangiaceae bacterium]
MNWSAVRELTRVAVAETESAWLDVARGKTVHQLEALVVGKSPGDGPSSAGKLDARRPVLRFEVAPETLALFREAMNSASFLVVVTPSFSTFITSRCGLRMADTMLTT